jgi:hypothetical protein
MDKLTAAEYRHLHKKVTPSTSSPIPKVEKSAPSTKDALVAMGKYFDLDPKKVQFYIRQTELGK